MHPGLWWGQAQSHLQCWRTMWLVSRKVGKSQIIAWLHGAGRVPHWQRHGGMKEKICYHHLPHPSLLVAACAICPQGARRLNLPCLLYRPLPILSHPLPHLTRVSRLFAGCTTWRHLSNLMVAALWVAECKSLIIPCRRGLGENIVNLQRGNSCPIPTMMPCMDSSTMDSQVK